MSEVTATCADCVARGDLRVWPRRALRQGLCQKDYRAAQAAGILPVKRLPTGETRPCSVPGCTTGKPAKAHGMCPTHNAQAWRGAVVTADLRGAVAEACSFPDCGRPGYRGDLCAGHNSQKIRGRSLTPLRTYKARGGPCEANDCPRKADNDGLCNGHYARRARGVADWETPIREKRNDGAGWYSDGYYIVRRAGRNRGHHLWLAEDLLGRSLRAGENVHHRNGVRADNRTAGPFRMTPHGKLVSGNLEIWSTKQPKGQEVGAKADWALEILGDYVDAWDVGRLAEIQALAARVTPEVLAAARARAITDDEVEAAWPTVKP